MVRLNSGSMFLHQMLLTVCKTDCNDYSIRKSVSHSVFYIYKEGCVIEMPVKWYM